LREELLVIDVERQSQEPRKKPSETTIPFSRRVTGNVPCAGTSTGRGGRIATFARQSNLDRKWKSGLAEVVVSANGRRSPRRKRKIQALTMARSSMIWEGERKNRARKLREELHLQQKKLLDREPETGSRSLAMQSCSRERVRSLPR